MRVEHNKTVVRKFADAINARDWDRLDRTVAPDFRRHSSAAPGIRSREELKQYLRREFESFPDAEESIEDIVAEGDKVAVRHRFRGTQHGAMGPYPPSGKGMIADYLAMYRLAGGVIVEAWVKWDNLSGLAQLGHKLLAEPGAAPNLASMESCQDVELPQHAGEVSSVTRHGQTRCHATG